MEKELLRSLQIMAWERAKGELYSILSTVQPNYDEEDYGKEYRELKSIFDKFILEVEDNTFLG